jgi:cytochrome c551/c552
VAADQNVTITQPIRVAIPADYLDKDMQLFKGDKDAEGNINWKEPVALPENKQLSAVEQGQILFQSKCASCHAIGKDMTGPDLAHFMKRFPLNEENANGKYYGHVWRAYEHVRKTEERDTGYGDRQYDSWYEESEHDYAYFLYKCNLRNRFPGVGPVFKSDTSNGEWLLNIYRYIQNESDRGNLALPWQAPLVDCADSCNRFITLKTELKRQEQAAKQKKQSLIKENGPLVDKHPDSTWPVVNAPLPPDFDKKVSPENYTAEYYQFTITSFGWHNIDALLNDVEAVQESELFVRITGQYQQRIKVYLIIPSVKTYGEGGPADRDPKEFAFFYKTGKLPLPQNQKAYILAVTDSEDSPAFGITEFTTSLKQELEVSLHAATKDEFTAAINQLHLDRLHITVADAKNADDIRKTNTDLKNIDGELKKAEQLKPKNCDCDCGREIGPESVPANDESTK